MPTNPFASVWEEVKKCHRRLDPKGMFIVKVPEDLRIRIEDLASLYLEVSYALMDVNRKTNTVRFWASKAVQASRKAYLTERKGGKRVD